MACLYTLNVDTCPSHVIFSLKPLLTFATFLLLGSMDLLLPPGCEGGPPGGPPVLLDIPPLDGIDIWVITNGLPGSSGGPPPSLFPLNDP